MSPSNDHRSEQRRSDGSHASGRSGSLLLRLEFFVVGFVVSLVLVASLSPWELPIAAVVGVCSGSGALLGDAVARFAARNR